MSIARTLWAVLVLAALAGGAAKIFQLVAPASETTRIWVMASKPISMLVYALALYFSLKIGGDYRTPSPMRTAWLLMCASCAAAVLRHGYEWFIALVGLGETRPFTWATLRQIPTVLTLVLLTASLVAMWWSFNSIGLRLRFGRGEVLLLLTLLTVVPFIFSLRDRMNDSQSLFPFIRGLQSLSPLLLAAPAVAGMVLHRLSQEIGEGQLARSLRYLVASLLIRLLALTIAASPLFGGIPALAVLGNALYWGSHWLFLIGITHRWRMTTSVSELAERYQQNPQLEVAELSTVLSQRGAERFF